MLFRSLLHTLSWWCGGIFMVLALVLSLLASRSSVGASEVQQRLRSAPAPVAPAPLSQAPTTGAAIPAPTTSAPAPATAAKPPATK